MKNIILTLALAFSTGVFADSASTLFPRIYNYGNSIQIQVWNHTDRYVTCSGSVWLTNERGVSFPEYYFENIMPRVTSYRTIYPRNFQDRIRSVNHNIMCR